MDVEHKHYFFVCSCGHAGMLKCQEKHIDGVTSYQITFKHLTSIKKSNVSRYGPLPHSDWFHDVMCPQCRCAPNPDHNLGILKSHESETWWDNAQPRDINDLEDVIFFRKEMGGE